MRSRNIGDLPILDTFLGVEKNKIDKGGCTTSSSLALPLVILFFLFFVVYFILFHFFVFFGGEGAGWGGELSGQWVVSSAGPGRLV